MNQHLQTILNLIQQAKHFTDEEKTALLKAAKNADKELEITAFKLDRTEKVKRTTAILLEETIEELEHKRKAVEAQNRELEIEAALERVRTVAMGMSKQEDLLNISKIQFNELKQLGFTEIRNTLIGIFHDDKNYFADYDYSDFSGGSITNIPYNKNPVIDRSLKQMKSATDAFTEFIVEGNELEEWKAFRKQNGEYDDARITNAVYYYFYSIEQGNVGISAFKKISEEQLYILKKFRNVFDLAYKRYVDITNAEAQAREAQIQLALERVRARTMAMQHSDELPDAANILFQQMQALGMPAWSAGYCIWDDDHQAITLWMSSAGIIQKPFRALVTEDPSFIHFYDEWKKGETFYVEEIGGDAIVSHYQYMLQLPVVGEMLHQFIADGSSLPTFQIFHLAFFSQGFLLFITYEPVPEAHDIFKRFGKVFEQTYTRFLDMQKAEAQAREAQIEAALEKVRSRSLAVHKTEEFKDVVKIVFEKLQELGIETEAASINIIIEGSKDIEVYIGGHSNDGLDIRNFRLLYLDDIISNDRWNAQQSGIDFFSKTYSKEEKDAFFKYQFEFSAMKNVPDDVRNIIFNSDQYTVSMAFARHSITVVNNFEGKLLSAHEVDVLKRFSRVFEQAYVRFLDLQKAEAQARESQIQLALERVRARTMAMQNSDELKDAAALLFQQVKSLGAPAYSCGYNIWEKDDKEFTSWMSTQDGSIINGVPNIPLTEDANFIRYVESKQNGEPFFVLELRGKRMQEHYQYLKTIPAFKAFFDYTVSVGFDLPETQIHHLANFSQGNLLFITLGPCPEFHDVFKRFAAVFEQTYTRFLDLQKAEAQAREAQIEAALERVRSRSMGMQKSEELKGVIQVVHEQFVHLNINTEHTGFVMDYKGRDDYDIWIADQLGVPSHVTIPYFDCVYYNRFNEAKKKGEDFFATNLDFEEKNRFYKKIIEYVPGLPEETKEFLFSIPGLAGSTVLLENIGLYIENFSGIPFSDDENNILMRFGKVFQQTYTRFLDLQKAEAQAREAQIEAALERVRSRTIAMQRSEDLFAVIREVNAQLQLLNFRFDSADFLTDYSDNGYKIWVASVQESFAKPFYITASDNKISELLKETMERGYNFFTFTLNQEEKNKYFDHVFQTPVAKDASDESKQFIYDAKGMAISCFVVKNIILSVSNFACIPYKDAENEIIRRFAFVFEQTYTRFLDLQKAEAQAREAQVETALEKVRSRSLAMHKSAELQEVVHTVFEKLKELNVDLYTAIIFIFKEGSKDVVWWLANKANQQYARILVPYADNPYLKDMFDAKENGKDFFAATYSFEEKNELFHHLFEHTDFRYVPEPQKKFLLESELATMSIALAKNTGINITSYSRKTFSESDNEILKRFAKVFDQAYTRFLDLQKAEAQAREAQIEAALEKVRSRTMAMHKSEELIEVIASVFQQLEHLSFRIDSANLFLNYKENPFKFWMAVPGYLYPSEIDVPYADFALMNLFIREIKSNATLVTAKFNQEEKNEWVRHLIQHSVVGNALDEKKKQMFEAPGLAMSVAGVKNIALAITNYSVQSYSDEENEILKRFVIVFDQTYTRFLDLQKAEAHALEAIKRASVDRVRAEIASMRTTTDLERITPLIWNELTTLGVPFVRCGVFIMDEEKQLVETHLSTPDGKAIASFTSTFSGTQLLTEILPYWQRKEIYKAHWDEASFLEQAKSLVQQGSVTSGEKYLTENRPTDLYLHFLPFLQGMLYAGNTAPLSDDELQSMQNLADAFSTAYARYEDFNKLEEAKGKIETTLSELKATQHQLIQSEKMASLGELTAGIAHEIQNPLNFVNNFSEVNSELISELVDEVDKGNMNEVKAIAKDIKDNEEKINHHGKRADAIVKGMLQHSRKSEGKKEPTDINALCDEYLRLSYHGLRAKDKSFNADFKTDFDESINKINIVPQDIGRVLLNLINNAFYAVNEKKKLSANSYQPIAKVSTRKLNNVIEIRVEDNGNGITQDIVDKIFQPFFTTKPTGSGTGLGLSLSYDIIKVHGGEIKVNSKEGEGSTFTVQLPVV